MSNIKRKEINLDEVEKEIFTILQRNKNVNSAKQHSFCNENNIETCLQILSNDFDSFDLPVVDSGVHDNSLKSVLVNLINSSHALIQLHRKSLRQISDLKAENKELNVSVDIIKKNILLEKQNSINKEKEVKSAQEKFRHLKMNLSNSQKENTVLKQKVNVLKRSKDFKEVQFDHKMKKMETEKRIINEKLKKNCGTYVSLDEATVSKIQKYKENEEAFKATICQLEKNNQALISEVLDLKEEAVQKSYNKNQ